MMCEDLKTRGEGLTLLVGMGEKTVSAVVLSAELLYGHTAV
jgi:hypothetical protein